MGAEGAWDLTRFGRVVRALEEASLRACEVESGGRGDAEVVQLTVGVVAAVWQSVEKDC